MRYLIVCSLAGLTLLCVEPAEARRYPARRAVTFPIARAYAKKHRLRFYSYHLRYIGNAQGLTAPIVKTKDGGYLIVATWRPPGPYRIGVSKPLVVRLDQHGKRLWQRAYPRRGFKDYEAASAIEVAPDRFVVYILSYVHPARSSVTRLLLIDDKKRGKVIWHRQLRGNGGPRTPFPQTVALISKNRLLLKGHIYTRRGERHIYGWTGIVDAKTGRVLSEKTGQRNPYRRNNRSR
jgi:hypothetical protein